MEWHVKNGKYWMVQWQFAGWFSFGIHIEPRKRISLKEKIPYGPYIDIHLFCFIISFGRNPWMSNPYAADTVGRGGLEKDVCQK